MYSTVQKYIFHTNFVNVYFMASAMSSQYKNITFQQKIMLQKCFITYTTDIMKAAGCFVQKRQVRQSEMWHNLQGTQQNVPANFLINCTKRTRDYYCCFFKAKGCHTKY